MNENLSLLIILFYLFSRNEISISRDVLYSLTYMCFFQDSLYIIHQRGVLCFYNLIHYSLCLISEHDKRYGKQSYSRERSERKDRESSRRKDNERQIRDRTQKHYDDNRDFDRHASYSQNITRKERNNDGNRDFDRHSSYSQNITRKERNNDGNRDKDRHSSYHHETTRKKKHFDDSDRNSDKNYNRDSDKEQVKEHGRSLEKERSPKDSRDDRDKDYRDKREQRNIIEVKNRLDSRTLNPFKRPDSGNRYTLPYLNQTCYAIL